MKDLLNAIEKNDLIGISAYFSEHGTNAINTQAHTIHPLTYAARQNKTEAASLLLELAPSLANDNDALQGYPYTLLFLIIMKNLLAY